MIPSQFAVCCKSMLLSLSTVIFGQYILDLYMIQLDLWSRVEKYKLATKDMRSLKKLVTKMGSLQIIKLTADFKQHQW